MRLKTWLVATLGLASLVVLLAVSMLTSARRANDIYEQLDALNSHHREVEANQQALRDSISETERLVGESEKMLRRHRQERQDDDE